MPLVNNKTETLSQFIDEVREGLDSINDTIPPFLMNLLNNETSSVFSQLSKAVCGKRTSIFNEHRQGDGMTSTLSWLFEIVMNENRVGKEKIPDPEFGEYCSSLTRNVLRLLSTVEHTWN
ncbi:hypothetical protein ElyMa_005113700 [Elysia marginata]|uniref:Uncharacterized protein n=1 Tax=Elysia marginata TaxID=1093978 RepID=A0AAV4JM80_9GAST|nr:hypothetical protein ElyMa_005113700 [Elysia marginata]